MALTYTDLVEVDLGRLGTAVADWKATVAHLKTLAHDAKTGMQAKSDAARWAGANATVTQAFVRKTAKEIGDLHTEAESIFQVLDDAHQELVTLQRAVKDFVDQAERKNLKITDNGDTTVSVMERLRPGEPVNGISKAAIKKLADSISSKVGRADEIDQSVKFALAKIHGNDMHNAGHSSYGSLNDAQAARALDLARKGTRMTNAELKELNRILKYNSGEKGGEFATDFYAGLGGPKKALEFYGSMTIDGTNGTDKTRLALARELQRGMGVALANATDKDHDHHLPASWGSDFRRLGTQRLKIDGTELSPPYGYQVLGGLLRYGDYDPEFLNPIAGHIVQLHHKDPNLFMLNKPNGLSVDADFGFNPSGKVGAGYDPLTSALEALGHSPEASKEFFSDDSPTAYDADGAPKGGKLGYNYFDELTGKGFKWPSDGTSVSATAFGVDALGHALESATLGHAYDDPHPVLVRDEKSAEVMEKVVQHYGSDAKLLKQQEILSDSLGRMGAGYIDDIKWGLDQNDSDSLFAPRGDIAGHALFGRQGARDFLSVIGQHPDAYSDISLANRVYTSVALENQVGDDGVINHGAARAMARSGAEIQGMMDQARADQVKAEGIKADKEYNDALEKRHGWIEFGATAALAGGVAFLPEVAAAGVVATAIPAMTDAGEGAIEQVIGNAIGDWTESSQKDSGDDVQEQVSNIYAAGESNAEKPVEEFKRRHHVKDDEDFAQDLEEALNSGYEKGTSRESQQGKRPQTGD